MTTLSMPTSPNFQTARWGMMTNTQVFISPLSGNVQTLELVGARFAADYIMPAMTRAEAASWYAFLMELSGQAGRFFAFDPLSVNPQGAITGSTLLVNGASQTGKTLICDGASASTTVLKKGDYFSVNDELKIITADAISDGAGNITLSFTPSLRASPAEDAPLTIDEAKCTMMLADDQQAFYDIDTLKHCGVRFSGVEVFA